MCTLSVAAAGGDGLGTICHWVVAELRLGRVDSVHEGATGGTANGAPEAEATRFAL